MLKGHGLVARPLSLVIALVLSTACQGGDGPSVETERNASALAPGSYVWQAEAIAPATSPAQPTSANLQVPPGANIISFVNNGGFAKYANVNFGAAGTYKRFVARLSTPYWENHVKVHLGSLNGPVIADLGTWATGTDFGTMKEESTPLLQDVSGTHDVWLEFDGSTNFAACQTYCFGTSPPSPTCQEVLTEGCGYGIGNFDWFALAPVEGTQISMALTPGAPVAGQPFTMLYTVTSASGVPTPDGLLSFPPSSSTSTVSQQGTASFGNTLAAGTYTFTVAYQGTGYLPSTNSFTVVVAPAP